VTSGGYNLNDFPENQLTKSLSSVVYGIDSLRGKN